jgi:hypothetical protein
MKYFFSFVLISFLFSCKDENQDLLDGLSGKWKVSSATFKFIGSKQDSVVNYSNSYYEFFPCNSEANNSGTRCNGTFSESGKKYTMTYFITANRSQINIHSEDRSLNDVWNSSYMIEGFSKSSCTLITILQTDTFKSGIEIKLVK